MLDKMLERAVLKTCHPVKCEPPVIAFPDVSLEMRALLEVMPEIGALSKGKRVVDFGCGLGAHSVGLAELGAEHVVGLDINETFLARSRDLAAQRGVDAKTSFLSTVDTEAARFDVVLSYNSMEHFSDPRSILSKMRDLVHEDGRVCVAFSPPWLSPYGAHFAYITPIPWVHLVIPERVLMRVRARYRSDGARRFEDIEGGLNRMTVGKFADLVHDVGFRCDRLRLTPMRHFPNVTTVPWLREFFTSRVSCVLRPA